MPQHGKKYREAAARIDREHLYGVAEAVDLVKEASYAKFDETVELAVRLGVDPRKADQIVRGTLSLPSGTGRTVRVAVFAAGEQAAEARAAGADVVGADDLVARVGDEGFLDFDVAIATPDLMGQVGTLGRVLGPRGLMPNPKTGTVTTEVGKAVVEFKGGRVEYRTDKVGNVHIRVGKVSFTKEQLLANMRAVIEELVRAKPAGGQGPLPARGLAVHDHGPRRAHRPGPGSGGRRGARRWRPDRVPRTARLPAGTDLTAVDLRCAARCRKGPRARLTRRRHTESRSVRRTPEFEPPVEERWRTRERRRWPWSTRCVSASANPRRRWSPSTGA